MKNLSIIFIILVALVLTNCENPRFIEAGVHWTDDANFSVEGDWYLAVSEGCYSSCEGATVEVLDQYPISANKNGTQKFMLGSGAEGNLTAFVYYDSNGNGSYDDGYDVLTGYKYNYATAGKTTFIAVSAYY